MHKGAGNGFGDDQRFGLVEKAAHRAANLALPALKAGYSLRFAFLPAGEDPDSFLGRSGAMAMQALLDAALPLSQVLTLLAFAGGLLASIWHASTVFKAGSPASKWARVLSVLWLLSFAVWFAMGLAHHMISFNQWY